MKTTIEIADPIFRQVKARAALAGKSMRWFVNQAIMEKLKLDAGDLEDVPKGWRAVFGKAPKDAIDELQARLDEEFSRIDPEEWS